MTDVTPPPPPAPEPAPAPYTPVPSASAPSASAPYAATPYSSAPAGPKTNTLGIISLVLAVLWISIPAVICGHIALSQIKTRAEGGRGLALAGLIVGYVGIVGGFVVFLIALLPFLIIGTAGGFSY